MQITQDFISPKRLNRPGKKITPKYITIHDVGIKGSTAFNHVGYLNTTSRCVSWHFTVDDISIYQHLPLDEVGFHTGTDKGNESSIGIEICEFHDPGKRAKAEANAVWLVRELLKQFKAEIVQHNFWNGKNCPHVLRERPNGWEDFLKEIYKKEEPQKELHSDIKGHWAEKQIQQAITDKLIFNYPDGTFKPDSQMTRAEAVAFGLKLRHSILEELYNALKMAK